MQDLAYYEDKTDPLYNRTIYNEFLDTPFQPIVRKNRIFMYPPILASIGVEIEGNHLGLGTNLSSNMGTLVKEYGLG